MSHQQQQQQGEHPSVSAPLPPQTREEVTRPQVFSRKMEEVSAFINAACLYIRMKMTEEVAAAQMAWVLSYI